MTAWGLSAFLGVFMLPDSDVDPSEVVTPTEAAERLDVPASTIRTWISRSDVKPLGKIGRYNVYDFRDLARLECRMRFRPDESAAA